MKNKKKYKEILLEAGTCSPLHLEVLLAPPSLPLALPPLERVKDYYSLSLSCLSVFFVSLSLSLCPSRSSRNSPEGLSKLALCLCCLTVCVLVCWGGGGSCWNLTSIFSVALCLFVSFVFLVLFFFFSFFGFCCVVLGAGVCVEGMRRTKCAECRQLAARAA